MRRCTRRCVDCRQSPILRGCGIDSKSCLLVKPPSLTGRFHFCSDLLCFHYAATSRLSHVKIPTLGHIQTLCVRYCLFGLSYFLKLLESQSTQVNGHTWRFIGDSQGWLYSNKDIVSEDRLAMHHWLTEFNIQPSSPVSIPKTL